MIKNTEFQYLLLIGIILLSVSVYIFIKLSQRRKILNFFSAYRSASENIIIPPIYILIVRYAVYSVFSVLICISILNPSFDKNPMESSRENSGVDILFVVDVSFSMNSVDTTPDRMSRFKEVLLHLLPELNGNRMGIITFAGSPFLYCPMTSDIGAFSDYIKGIDVDMIPNSGTNIKSAFAKAKDVLSSGKVLRNRILVFVSDGEDFKNNFPDSLDANMIVWGLGKEEGGPIFYRNQESGIEGYVTKSRNLAPGTNFDDLIISRIDEEFLLKLAAKNNAEYVNLTQNPAGASILLDKISSMTKNESKRMDKFYKKDGYQYFLFPAILLLIIDLTLIEYILKKKLKADLEKQGISK